MLLHPVPAPSPPPPDLVKTPSPDAEKLPPTDSFEPSSPAALYPDRAMPSVPPVTVDDDDDAELGGPWVSLAVPVAAPTPEVDGDAPFGGGGAVVAAASSCRLEEERLVGTCQN